MTIEEYMPDKRMWKMFPKRRLPFSFFESEVLILPSDKKHLHEMILTFLGYYSLHVMGGINPPSVWVPKFEKYYYSREFLQNFLNDLSGDDQTEGALLVIKKLSEMDAENNRFDL